MRRSPHIVSTQLPRKAVSFALERVFPSTRSGGLVQTESTVVSATPRVRDSLVLRLVAKKKPAGRSPSNEHDAR